ncbi:TIGR03621 family F420-dependent LLM class oxidoreductase [Streptomyces sp. XM4193]|uniref:TIGR03621 family F420-dependent LLM class oxidoreductase n=1 Tax=Streptomyces sp. XM4193 TaxID=2929782 RepID=UPI001FFAFB83|nr:TIGR03621 family F420-dependent LLM class oxidoreductase [Streptomyces sp. XM4193]MCK1797990.1 TIGR03621 family F420-dependent LLM class oxidoreductase [Streptomyces sp. XM4193]
MTTPFRFGINMLAPPDRAAWAAQCRTAESIGFDVLLVPDHLGMPAPFPSLVAAAEATERPRVGTFVLNAGLWNPALLAREVATTDRLTGGRLELGLGAGYVKAEHDEAGLPFGTPGERVDALTHLVTELERLLDDPDHAPAPVQSPLPLLLGGNGDRLLRLAARHARTAAFTAARQVPGAAPGTLGLIAPQALAERLAVYRGFEAGRSQPAELNLLVQKVEITGDRRAAAERLAELGPGLSVDQLLDHPGLLLGTAAQIAEQLRAHRERFGFSYFTVLSPDMRAFAPVVEELAGH